MRKYRELGEEVWSIAAGEVYIQILTPNGMKKNNFRRYRQ